MVSSIPLILGYDGDGNAVKLVEASAIGVDTVSANVIVSGGVDLLTLLGAVAGTDHGALTGLSDDDHSDIYLTSTKLASNNNGSGASYIGVENGIIFGGATEVESALLAVAASANAHFASGSVHFLAGDVDHSNLANLGVDSHAQYARTDGSRDITGDQTFDTRIAVNTGASPDPIGVSVALDVSATNLAILLPRVDDIVGGDIVTPVAGMLVYSTVSGCAAVFDGSNWIPTSGPGS